MTTAEKQFGENPHSVEISINAKGQFSGKVKVYASSIDEAIQLATEKAIEIETIIKEKNSLIELKDID